MSPSWASGKLEKVPGDLPVVLCDAPDLLAVRDTEGLNAGPAYAWRLR